MASITACTLSGIRWISIANAVIDLEVERVIRGDDTMAPTSVGIPRSCHV